MLLGLCRGLSLLLVCVCGIAPGADQNGLKSSSSASDAAANASGSSASAASDNRPAEGGEARERRTQLNLVGAVDTNAGESRRNENVYFNPIDNNALKELNVRLGTTATIVDRFSVDRNYFGAEFGNPPTSSIHEGPTVALRLHGQAFWVHDNSVFRARSFFQVGDVKPARENNYGFSITTPVWANAFLFVDGARQQVRGTVNGNVLVPNEDERVPLTTDPELRPIVQRFLAAYPAELPNRTDINPRALNTNAPQRIDTENVRARLEQQWRNSDVFRFGYALTSQKVDAFQLVAGQNPDTRTLAHTARFTWARVWSPSRTTNLSAGFDRVYSQLVPEPNAVGPSVSFGSAIEPLGPASDFPINRAQNLFRYAGQARLVEGPHSWTLGFDLVRRQINGSEVSSHRGVLSFRDDFGRDAMTNFLLGIPSRFSGAVGNVHQGFRNWETHVYAGDDWHAHPNLLVSYGIRFQPVTAPREVNGLVVIPYSCDCNNLAPRFGFAYRLPRWWGLLRGTYGLHYGEIFPVTFQQLRFNPPLNQKFELQAPDLANLLETLNPGNLDPDARSTVFELDSGLSTPYSHQYNFSWEPVLPSNWKLQVGYVGSRSHRLLTMWHTNRAQPASGIEQTTSTINLRRPNPNFFDIRRALNGSIGYFDAARVTLLVPSWRGLTMDASFWISKAIDLGGNYTSTAAGEDGRQGRSQSEQLFQQDLKGLSSFDQPHAALFRISYLTPVFQASPPVLRTALARWNFSLVVLAKTGTPFTVLSGSDAPGFGNVDGASGDRPNVVDPSVLGRTIGHPDTSAALLPRSAFGFIQPNDFRGNLGAYTFRKGRIRNINAAIFRTWILRHDKSMTLRLESLNLLNTPQFAEPGKELTSPSFAQITNTLNDGRTFQFLLRFAF